MEIRIERSHLSEHWAECGGTRLRSGGLHSAAVVFGLVLLFC